MRKRLKKKLHNKIYWWIVFKQADGTFNSLGINGLGYVPTHARPLNGDFKTLNDVLSIFKKGVKLPYVELNQEEENMLFYDWHVNKDGSKSTGNREEFGFWGEKYLEKKINEGDFSYMSR